VDIIFCESRRKKTDYITDGILIDDDPMQCLACAENGIHTILFLQPYNRHTTHHPLIHRAEGWGEVLEIIGRLEETK
jgi:hypothetical protein